MTKPKPEKELKAYLTDRFAEAIRQADPFLEDKSFEWAKPYADEVVRYLTRTPDLAPKTGEDGK